jgi:hypothetical protein
VGVLTATSPTGPWASPLSRSLIDGNTKEIGEHCTPFDPGVVIDDDGVGWLAFGGSHSFDDPDKDYMPGGARIVKLGSDMISLASEIVEIPAPYHFEANELNFINGTYVYTYNNSWITRARWDLPDIPAPTACSMSYMTTKTPLDPDSWIYQGHYFVNPGYSGFDYSNNHTHLHKFKGEYYLFYHTHMLQRDNKVSGGFRSISADIIEVDESNITINMAKATREGVEQIKHVDPYVINLFSNHANSLGISFEKMDDNGNMYTTGMEPGGWVFVRGVDFGENANAFTALVKGTGSLAIKLNDIQNDVIGQADFSADGWDDITITLNEAINGLHDVFFVFDGKEPSGYSWRFN